MTDRKPKETNVKVTDYEITRTPYKTNLHIGSDATETLKPRLAFILNSAAPQGRLDTLADMIEALPDDFPEKPKASIELTNARKETNFHKREVHIKEILLKFSDAIQRNDYRRRTFRSTNAGKISGDVRKERGNANKAWVLEQGEKFIKAGRSPRDISSIIHSKIYAEISDRHDDSGIDFPGKHCPSADTIRRWTKDLREKWALKK